jgi:hypothetical protein
MHYRESIIRLLSKLHSIPKIALFGIFREKIFGHVVIGVVHLFGQFSVGYEAPIYCIQLLDNS